MTHIVRQIPEMFHFWESQIIQDVVENSYIDRINPSSGFEARTQGDLKFVIPGNESFVNLSKSYLYLKLKLTGSGKKGADDVTVKHADFDKTGLSVVNAIAHSIFRSLEVRLGGTIITQGDSDYGYRAYIQLLFNTTKEAQETYFHVVGWEKDTAGKFDSFTENKALENRRKNLFTLTDEATGEFLIRPHTGLTFLNKNIIPYEDIELTFRRHGQPKFYMMSDVDLGWNIEIVQAAYDVQRYKATTPFVTQVEMMLKEHPLIYNIRDSKVHTCTIPQGVQNYNNDGLFRGSIPRHIIIAFVSAGSYNGDMKHNPYRFHHFEVSSLRLLKNGLDYPTPATETNFLTAPNSFMQAYHRVMLSMGADYNDHVLSITPEEYAKGYFFYSFYMAPDQEVGSDLNNISGRPAQIKVDVQFSKPLTETVQMLIYSEYDTEVKIDITRRVLCTHK